LGLNNDESSKNTKEIINEWFWSFEIRITQTIALKENNRSQLLHLLAFFFI
jgi:hypothetical protein